jgi:lipopolysaccharide transport system ATP-binding protein
MDTVIVSNVSKRFKIPHEKKTTLLQNIVGIVKRQFAYEEFWALREVGFSVKNGESLGIIGRNGSGKSTLLKILAGVLYPDSGSVTVDGRVACFLELGVGFQYELTAKENVYIYGSILGMSNKEVSRKYDEIFDFAELKKFESMKLKNFSSGMYVRLAFATAVHANPNIMLIDEVFAVGDEPFQKKCAEKMLEFRKQGKTIVFVSHALNAVQRLCPRCLLLDNGRVASMGDTEKVVNDYLALIRDGRIQADRNSDEVVRTYLKGESEEASGIRRYSDETAPGDYRVRLKSICLANREGKSSGAFGMDEEMRIRIEFTVRKPISDFHLYIRVFTSNGVLAFTSADWDNEAGNPATRSYLPGTYQGTVIVPAHLLNRGSYFLMLGGMIPNSESIFIEDKALAWEIKGVGGIGGMLSAGRPGIFRPRLDWSVIALKIE